MIRKLMGFGALAAVLAMPAAAQTADEIIAKNIEAHGGLAKLKAMKSMRMTGRMTLGQGIEAPITIEVVRPKNMRLEITVQGMTIIQAYDGTTGWQVVPFTGSTDPQVMSADELKDAEEQADMDGALVDYKEKGHSIELMGKENVEGADCFKLMVTKKNGDVQYYFIDSDSYLELKTEGKRKIRGTETEIETSLGDYKDIGNGVVLPHAISGGAKGSPQRQNIMVDKIEINPEIDAARFKMPAAAPKPATPPPSVN
jgi:outer membrane lipoprotein-sorting protein